MNIKVMAFLTKSSKLGFVFACALIGGAGWGARIGVQQMDTIYNEFSETFKLSADDEANTPILIVAHGEVKLRNNGHEITTLKKGEVYGELFQDGAVSKITTLTATERSVVFKINLMDFYFVMANHHELVQGLIKNITEENRPQVV